MGSRESGSSFSWKIDAAFPISSITFAGDFDLQACRSIVNLTRSVPARTTGVLLDLSEVSFIDSNGLRRLMELKQELLDRDVRLFLNKISPTVKRVLDLSGIDGFFEFADGRRKSWWQGFKKARVRKKS